MGPFQKGKTTVCFLHLGMLCPVQTTVKMEKKEEGRDEQLLKFKKGWKLSGKRHWKKTTCTGRKYVWEPTRQRGDKTKERRSVGFHLGGGRSETARRCSWRGKKAKGVIFVEGKSGRIKSILHRESNSRRKGGETAWSAWLRVKLRSRGK